MYFMYQLLIVNDLPSVRSQQSVLLSAIIKENCKSVTSSHDFILRENEATVVFSLTTSWMTEFLLCVQ